MKDWKERFNTHIQEHNIDGMNSRWDYEKVCDFIDEERKKVAADVLDRIGDALNKQLTAQDDNATFLTDMQVQVAKDYGLE